VVIYKDILVDECWLLYCCVSLGVRQGNILWEAIQGAMLESAGNDEVLVLIEGEDPNLTPLSSHITYKQIAYIVIS
jgi:hypothetical protein